MKVLDLRCGIGGSSRLLSSEFVCNTIGIDITEENCRAAAELSKLVGLDERTEYRVGDATELPFDNDSIGVVWTEHVQMNIEDKTKFYSEIYRVLKKKVANLYSTMYLKMEMKKFISPYTGQAILH